MDYNVKDFGAIGDGKSIDTKAIQAAIDECSKNGGGRVIFEKGKYVCSTIFIKSYVQLFFGNEAYITSDEDVSKYSHEALLYADGEEFITISGYGGIMGNGNEKWGSWWGITTPRKFKNGMLLFENCKNISITGVSFMYSEWWTIHLSKCENVEIDHVKILNNFYRLNTDGIDPCSCKNVIISNCHIVAGDDCIVTKTVDDVPCENVLVTNCILETPNTAIKLGTESDGDFRDIHASNCVIEKAAVGIGIFVKDGATVERVTFSNISIKNFDIENIKPVTPIFADIEKRTKDSRLGYIKNVTFDNIHIDTQSSAVLQGLPHRKIENITMTNITYNVNRLISFAERKKPITGKRELRDQQDYVYVQKPSYMTFANIDGLYLNNVKVIISADNKEENDKQAVYCANVSDCVVENVVMKPYNTTIHYGTAEE